MAITWTLTTILCWASVSYGHGEITTRTRLGQITGIRRTVLDNDLFEFRKIPFAKAPVGELRFERPIPYGPWEGTLDGTKFGTSCYQNRSFLRGLINNNISEDCLFLNVYVPFNISSNNKKSVMIWIHGGSYSRGQGTYYDGSHLAITGNVIVVTINYRLNIFGFLSIDAIKGNYGLWDQIMAIQWVKDNIASFGGNSQSITIFGESAGGFSVGLLSIIPKNRGLFQRVILQSGVAFSSYSVMHMTNLTSTAIAGYLSCAKTNPIVQCLKNRSASEIYALVSKFKQPNALSLPWAPVIDGELLPTDPLTLLKNTSSDASAFFQSLDVIIGTVSGESSLLIYILKALEKQLKVNITGGIPKRILTDFLVPQITNVCCSNSLHVASAINNQYGQSSDIIGQTEDILDAYSDFLFDTPAIQSLHLHSGNKRGRQFHYVFSKEPPFPLYEELPSWFQRSEHGADTIFEFPQSNKNNLSTINMELSKNFMKYWTNFARTG
jgi:carboxylesterase type B